MSIIRLAFLFLLAVAASASDAIVPKAATLGDGSLQLATDTDTTTGAAVPISKLTFGPSGTNSFVKTGQGLPTADAAAEASLATLATNSPTLVGGAVPVAIGSIALPTGASTSALQTTGNGSLSTIATNTTGLATAAAQTTAQTSLSAIAASVAGTQMITGTVAVSGTVPVSASALPLPTGASTSALQTTGNSTLATIATELLNPLPLMTGAATSSAQATSNTSLSAIQSSLAGTLAVSASALPLPSGAATSALQTTGNTSLATIATNSGTQATAGNQNTSNSYLTTIATNTTGLATASGQSTAATTLSTIATNTTGASTSANQATEISSLATIATNTTPASAGQKTSANSISFVTASDDSNVGPGTHVAGATISAVNQDIIAAMDVSAYSYMVFTLDNAGTTCIISWQFSNDLTSPTNWYSFGLQRIDLQAQNSVATTTNSTGPNAGPLGFKWLRIRCTTYGSGSPTGSLQLSPRPIANAVSYNSSISLTTATNLGPANTSHLVAAATTNATQVRASAAVLEELDIGNNNATTAYWVKVYNVASGLTVGTTVPVASYYIPAKSARSINFGATGKRLSNGFALAITGAAADNDTTAVTSAGDVVVSWNY